MTILRVTRRAFITGLGSAAAWPVVGRAQPRAVPIIGYLSSGTAVGFGPLVEAFRRGLNEVGFVEGSNFTIAFRWSEGEDGPLPTLVSDLISRNVSVIAATGGSAPAVAAKAATSTIPIVFTGGQDPVKLHLVESLDRPGGNATGVLNVAPVLTSKRLEILRDLAANPDLIAVLRRTELGANEQTAELEAAAARLGQKIQFFNANTESEFSSSFAAISQMHAGALYVVADPFLTSRAAQLIALAAQYHIPASYSFRSFAMAGGLMTYGANLADQHRAAGVYVGKILKGAKPSDLPVLQPTKFDLVINLRTAKALGLEVPPKLLALADEVIE